MGSWHDAMAEAVSSRQHALNGINRWQEKLRAAEAQIESLSKGHNVNEAQPSSQTIKEQVDTVPNSLNPVFGISQDA